jgi:hypothetical protein
VTRLILLAAVGLTAGCASTVDTMTSRRFRQDPFGTMFKSEDPVAVLRDTSRGGDERARAMRRLTEPAAEGRSQEQDEIVNILSAAATSDPSPVVRVAAVDALGRFRDERVVSVLTTAYTNAGGGIAKPATDTPFPLAGPTGFSPEMVTMIRTRVVESMGDTGRSEVVPMLAKVATSPESETDRDTRLAAVRGLAKLRQPESAVALAQVLAAEKGKDPALAGRAHDGLIHLTGLNHPADPERWAAVVQAGAPIAEEPNPVVQAVKWVGDR